MKLEFGRRELKAARLIGGMAVGALLVAGCVNGTRFQQTRFWDKEDLKTVSTEKTDPLADAKKTAPESAPSDDSTKVVLGRPSSDIPGKRSSIAFDDRAQASSSKVGLFDSPVAPPPNSSSAKAKLLDDDLFGSSSASAAPLASTEKGRTTAPASDVGTVHASDFDSLVDSAPAKAASARSAAPKPPADLVPPQADTVSSTSQQKPTPRSAASLADASWDDFNTAAAPGKPIEKSGSSSPRGADVAARTASKVPQPPESPEPGDPFGGASRHSATANRDSELGAPAVAAGKSKLPVVQADSAASDFSGLEPPAVKPAQRTTLATPSAAPRATRSNIEPAELPGNAFSGHVVLSAKEKSAEPRSNDHSNLDASFSRTDAAERLTTPVSTIEAPMHAPRGVATAGCSDATPKIAPHAGAATESTPEPPKESISDSHERPGSICLDSIPSAPTDSGDSASSPGMSNRDAGSDSWSGGNPVKGLTEQMSHTRIDDAPARPDSTSSPPAEVPPAATPMIFDSNSVRGRFLGTDVPQTSSESSRASVAQGASKTRLVAALDDQGFELQRTPCSSESRCTKEAAAVNDGIITALGSRVEPASGDDFDPPGSAAAIPNGKTIGSQAMTGEQPKRLSDLPEDLSANAASPQTTSAGGSRTGGNPKSGVLWFIVGMGLGLGAGIAVWKGSPFVIGLVAGKLQRLFPAAK